MMHRYLLILNIMFGHTTRCFLIENRKMRESVDLLEAKLELEKQYRHEEFEILLNKLNEIEAKLKPGLTDSTFENPTVCKGDYVSAPEISNAEQDKRMEILTAAFRNEKEENQKYRRTLEEMKQAVDNLVGIVHEFKQELDHVSFAVKESFSTMNQCNIWRNEVGKSVSMLDTKMDATLTSLRNLDHMEFVVNVLNDTKTNIQMSEICDENGKMKNMSSVETKKYSSCKDLLNDGFTRSGVFVVFPNEKEGYINVYCDQETNGGGWTVFQRRQDGSVDFYRTWPDYKRGFGDIKGEFWLGNDILSTMTKGDRELRIELKDFKGNSAYATYGIFNVGSESTGYKLKVDRFKGTAKDSLKYHNGMKFSTPDKDNDVWTNGDSCAKKFKGCWWYKGCYQSNLNGVYHDSEADPDEDGLVWADWIGFRKSVKFVEMKFR